jgi:hypothetical protein
VSNSSTASFVVIGYSLSARKYRDYLNLIESRKDMLIEHLDDDIFLGKVISSRDRDDYEVNPDEEIDWEVVKAIANEGSRIGLGKPRIFKFSIDC